MVAHPLPSHEDAKGAQLTRSSPLALANVHATISAPHFIPGFGSGGDGGGLGSGGCVAFGEGARRAVGEGRLAYVPALRVEHFSADDSGAYDDKLMIKQETGQTRWEYVFGSPPRCAEPVRASSCLRVCTLGLHQGAWDR